MILHQRNQSVKLPNTVAWNFKECSVHFSRCPCLSSTINKAAKIGCRQASGCFSCPQALGLLKLLIYWEQMGSLSRPNNKQRSFLPCLNSCATVCACSSRLSRQCTLLRSTKILSRQNLAIFSILKHTIQWCRLWVGRVGFSLIGIWGFSYPHGTHWASVANFVKKPHLKISFRTQCTVNSEKYLNALNFC